MSLVLTLFSSALLVPTREGSAPSPIDPELLQEVLRARCGEAAAQSILVERYRTPIGRYVYTLILDRHAIDDVTQDVFIRMLRGLPRLREPEHFRAWLFRLARNSSFDYLRRQRLRKFWTTLSDAEFKEIPEANGGDQARHFAETFEHALRDFAPRDRELLALALQGHSYEEIAAQLGVSHGSVKGRLSRVREHLRLAMLKADSISPHGL